MWVKAWGVDRAVAAAATDASSPPRRMMLASKSLAMLLRCVCDAVTPVEQNGEIMTHGVQEFISVNFPFLRD